MNYFIVTRSGRGHAGAVYHGERPRLYTSTADGQRLHCGALVVYGPAQIPAALEGASIDDLMLAWQAVQAGRRPVVKVRAA